MRDGSSILAWIARLSPLGSKVGIPFLLLSLVLVASGIGWFRRRLWGSRLAVAIIATQVIGDIINLAEGDRLRGLWARSSRARCSSTRWRHE